MPESWPNSETCWIRLANKHLVLFDKDLWGIGIHKWQLKKDGPRRKYVRAKIDGHYVMMHHLVKGRAPDGLVIDHINGNGLDNRRCNLRFCTPSENSANRQSMKYGDKVLPLNVSYKPKCPNRPYIVRVTKNYKTYYFGHFATVEEAQTAAIEAKTRIHGAISVAS